MSAEATSGGSEFHSVSDARENENEDCELFKEGAGIGSKRFAAGASSSVGVSESVVGIALVITSVVFSAALAVVVVVVVVAVVVA